MRWYVGWHLDLIWCLSICFSWQNWWTSWIEEVTWYDHLRWNELIVIRAGGLGNFILCPSCPNISCRGPNQLRVNNPSGRDICQWRASCRFGREPFRSLYGYKCLCGGDPCLTMHLFGRLWGFIDRNLVAGEQGYAELVFSTDFNQICQYLMH